MNAAATLKHWSTLGTLGSTNTTRVAGALYSWDAQPRAQKNGALIGRVYAQRQGEPFRDIGHFKIAPMRRGAGHTRRAGRHPRGSAAGVAARVAALRSIRRTL